MSVLRNAPAPALASPPARVWQTDQRLDARLGDDAKASVAKGIVATRVSGKTIRQTRLRLGINGECAKQRITNPDPAYTQE